MNKNRLFRFLRADEIQVRPTDTATQGKASLLLYKDARCDANILDATFGPFGWQKEYVVLGGVTYCRVGIKEPVTNQWIWKSDAGSDEANIEQAKATASDAFKRACFAFGLGRELYETPRIRINCPDSYYYNGKMTMTFRVSQIEFNEDGKCVSLEIVDRSGNTVYSYPNGATGQQPDAPKYTRDEEGLKQFVSDRWATADKDGKHQLSAFFNENRTDSERLGRYGVEVLWGWFQKDLKDGKKYVTQITPQGVDTKPIWVVRWCKK